MNVAIPTLENRISPVFDVAQAVVIVELDGDRELHRQTVPLHARDIARRVAELSQRGVDVLICGAISGPLEAALNGTGIRVVPQTCGPVEEVLGAFVAGRLSDRAFLMPGCCGRRRRRQRGGGRGFGCASGSRERSRRQSSDVRDRGQNDGWT